WLVMKALEKDRGRRYETAGAFAADVQRYLDDEPVQACPPSALYRLRKFARRNKAALAGAGLVLAASLVGTPVGVWHAARANRARLQADGNLKKAREAVDQLLTRVAGDLANVPRAEKVRRALLQDALRFYEAFLRENLGEPALRYDVAQAQ